MDTRELQPENAMLRAYSESISPDGCCFYLGDMEWGLFLRSCFDKSGFAVYNSWCETDGLEPRVMFYDCPVYHVNAESHLRFA